MGFNLWWDNLPNHKRDGYFIYTVLVLLILEIIGQFVFHTEDIHYFVVLPFMMIMGTIRMLGYNY